MSEQNPTSVEKEFKPRLTATQTAVKILGEKTVAIAKVEVAPSSFPALISLILGGTSSYLFWSQGEADAFAPLFLGGGLALFWRDRKSSRRDALIRWSYLILFCVFLLERAGSHPVSIEGQWLMIPRSIGLYLCGFGSLLIPVAAWSNERALRSP